MNRFFLFAALAIGTALGTGCSSADEHNPPMLATTDADTPMPSPAGTSVCSNHEEGCPCDVPGETTDCGRIERIAGDYVWCSTGMQTCDEFGSWGKCTGDQIAAPPVAQ